VSIIVWLITGWLAGMAMGGRGFGVLGNIFVGIIGDFLVSTFHVRVQPPEHRVALVASIVFLLILRAVPGSQPLER